MMRRWTVLNALKHRVFLLALICKPTAHPQVEAVELDSILPNDLRLFILRDVLIPTRAGVTLAPALVGMASAPCASSPYRERGGPLRFHPCMHLVHMAGENSPSRGCELERGQGVRRSAYHISSTQNAWQDSRLAATSISTSSLWNLAGLICPSHSQYFCGYLALCVLR